METQNFDFVVIGTGPGGEGAAMLAAKKGLKVAAISVVTNLGAGLEQASPSHHETTEVGGRAAGDMQSLLTAFLEDFDD